MNSLLTNGLLFLALFQMSSSETTNDIVQLVTKYVRGCPYCDSSVYGYCTDKLLHDACCCSDPYVTQLPLQCKYADCSFLHANSCRDHDLITRCCCNKYI